MRHVAYLLAVMPHVENKYHKHLKYILYLYTFAVLNKITHEKYIFKDG